MNFTADEIFEESDEEINRLKQRICYRRKQKHNERINTFNLPASFDYQTECEYYFISFYYIYNFDRIKHFV